MLFNSYVFLFAFLPVVAVGFFALGALRWRRVALAWLVLASLYFYAFWNVAYVPLLAASIGVNYAIGYALARTGEDRRLLRLALLVAAIAANLALLGYFKYTDFAISSVNVLAGAAFPLQHVVLPLAISFFTFNQIAYVVDVYRREATEYDLLNYAFFVSFFPHLIAGPIVHHREIIPQLRTIPYRFTVVDVAVGSTIFAIGLFEKVVLADTIAPRADVVFAAAADGAVVGAAAAWAGAIAYALQLFFDFAGYSDMAIGAARIFGITFPFNFNAPYRATNIVDFWRRWHMTLSRFLRDYLYIALGGNRYGPLRRYANLAITMLLGGLWHGAAWTFVIWGGLHGVYLIINHGWERLGRFAGIAAFQRHPVGTAAGYAVTMIAVLVGWVFFRARDLPTALHLCASMAGVHGIGPLPSRSLLLLLTALAAAATILPNTQELLRLVSAPRDRFVFALQWRPSRRWSVAVGVLAAVAIICCSRSSSFLYYQF
ncbi:MAG: rane bound O-acyl transferase family protein [Candidatus Eremiobacteraeota bacterium]|nr:rane bound O-acyl transferase family protein [Candidatus Eremiobacteraeota bacterium]